MIYRIKGNLHLWDWLDLKDELNSKIIDFNTGNNIIYWIEFESDLSENIVVDIIKKYSMSITKKYKKNNLREKHKLYLM